MIALRFFEDWSHARIAQELDRNEGAIRALQNRALRRLCTLLMAAEDRWGRIWRPRGSRGEGIAGAQGASSHPEGLRAGAKGAAKADTWAGTEGDVISRRLTRRPGPRPAERARLGGQLQGGTDAAARISAPLSGLGGSSHLGLLLRVVLAGITGALIFASPNTTEEQPALVPEAASTRSVVTVGESISAGTEIEADMLVVKAISADAVLSGVVTDPNDVVGQSARIPLIASELLIESKCELHGRGGGPPLRDPQRHAGDGEQRAEG